MQYINACCVTSSVVLFVDTVKCESYLMENDPQDLTLANHNRSMPSTE